MVDPFDEPTPEALAARQAVERRIEEEFAEVEKVDSAARWPGHEIEPQEGRNP